MGGGKITAIHFTVEKGILVPDSASQITVFRNGDAAGYLPMLQKVGAAAQESGTPIGVACAGIIKGTQLIQTPNMPDFHKRLWAEYGGDFARLLPTVGSVNNDAEGAIKAAIFDARERGLLPAGEGQILAMEPGHVELVDLKRPLGQTIPDEPCGVFGQQFVCVERAIGGAAGVESRWVKTTGERLDGRQISELYKQGNPLATELYDTSAGLLATVMRGMGDNLELMGDRPRAGLLLPIIGGGFGGAAFVMEAPRAKDQQALTVAFHGGVNNVPAYMDRVGQIMKQSGTPISASFTESFSVNAGAEGAAIAALMARAA